MLRCSTKRLPWVGHPTNRLCQAYVPCCRLVHYQHFPHPSFLIHIASPGHTHAPAAASAGTRHTYTDTPTCSSLSRNLTRGTLRGSSGGDAFAAARAQPSVVASMRCIADGSRRMVPASPNTCAYAYGTCWVCVCAACAVTSSHTMEPRRMKLALASQHTLANQGNLIHGNVSPATTHRSNVLECGVAIGAVCL